MQTSADDVRVAGGNPQTGPFYVEGALPNDTLVVRLTRVRTNRDWAQSGSTIMRNALEPGRLANLKWDEPFNSRWKLDPARNVALLEKPTEALKGFTVALTADAGLRRAWRRRATRSVRTTDSGRFGGNMDYNQIREGTTVYLPVYHPGALLFLGDGHAAQGDGELTGDALETSMDFEFTVDLIRDRNFGHPLAENSEFLISIGIGGSLDQALQQATSGMVRWLDRDYKLTPSEAAMLLGLRREIRRRGPGGHPGERGSQAAEVCRGAAHEGDDHTVGCVSCPLLTSTFDTPVDRRRTSRARARCPPASRSPCR